LGQFYIFAINSSESEYFNEKVMKVEIKGSIPSITTQNALRLDNQMSRRFCFPGLPLKILPLNKPFRFIAELVFFFLT